MCGTDIFLGLLAILFPPIAVWVKRGICSADSFINLALCFLGFIPGLVHSWYIIAKYPDPTYTQVAQDSGENSTTGQHGVGPQHRQAQLGYGSVNNQAASSHSGQDGNAAGQYAHGNNTETPPSYADAVKGDHKVQKP